MRLSNIGWNLAGLSLPVLVAAVAVPYLLERLGDERFGLLALAWGLIGYAGALDLGIGRAVTQMVSRLRGEGNTTSIPNVLATAGRISFFAGATGGALIALFALSSSYGWIGATVTPRVEIRDAILLLAVALPAQAMSATYRGMNEAYQKFRAISLLRGGLGVITFGGPALVASYTLHLPALVATLVLSRLLALAIFRGLALSCVDRSGDHEKRAVYSGTIARSLFSFGGWFTASAIVGPVLIQADRFAVASVISAAAVTAYVLPYELVTQSLILVGSVSSVMFPSLTKLLAEDPDRGKRYFYRVLGIVTVAMLAVCLLLAFALPSLLKLWIQEKLQPQSVLIGQVLCLGVFANAFGAMFYTLLHAKGRADITAKLHIVELPMFLAALFILLETYGVVGAAWAWSARMVVDAVALAWIARWHSVDGQTPSPALTG